MRLLGPLELTVGGEAVTVPGPIGRRLVAAMALAGGRTVPVDRLIAAGWGDEPPGRSDHALHQQISTLRRTLRGDRTEPAADLIVRTHDGYALPVDELDSEAFTQARARARQLSADGDRAGAETELRAALALWRGDALLDARGTRPIDATADQLDEQRIDACEDMIALALDQGRAADHIAELRALVGAHPLRERLRQLLIVALYRAGRHAEALDAYQDARGHLAEELGLEPSPTLRGLEGAILRHDPALSGAAGAPLGDPSAATRAARATLPSESAGPRLELPDGQQIEIVDGMVIGRDPAAGVTLIDGRVSRRHAVLRVREGAVTVEDLGSTNGTGVNGESVSTRALVPGDELSVGGVPLRFTRRDEGGS